MPSPFPGMDPFIEGQDWEDFHTGFIAELSAALVPHVRPKYVVRKERRVYVEHTFPDDDRLVRADVAVMSDTGEFPESRAPASAGAAVSPVVLHLPMPQERREAFLTLRERETMEVFTSTYDRAGYDYSLDYTRPIRPPLPQRDASWAAGILG